MGIRTAHPPPRAAVRNQGIYSYKPPDREQDGSFGVVIVPTNE